MKCVLKNNQQRAQLHLIRQATKKLYNVQAYSHTGTDGAISLTKVSA